MKKRYTIQRVVASIFILSLLTISYQAMTNGNGPGGGYTSAPSESNCTSCHTGGIISSGTNWSNISLTGVPATGYIPGNVYTITLSYTQSSIVRFGFQATVLSNSNSMAGSFSSSGLSIQTSGSRSYIGHNSSSNFFSGNTATWTFSWTAPAVGVGNVTFYTNVNAANNDNASGGDQIYSKSFTFYQSGFAPPSAIITAVPTTVCVGDTVSFSGSGLNTPTGYSWSFGFLATPTTSTAQNPKVVYNTAGTYNAQLITSNSFGTSSPILQPIIVLAKTIATVNGTAQNLCGTTDSITLSAPNGTGLNYLWTPGNLTSQNIVVKNSGSYKVRVTNANNCVSTSPNFVITQHAIPIVTLITSADSICQGDTVTFTGNGAYLLTYQFLKDTQTVQNNTQKIYKTSLLNSSNVFKIMAIDSFGCKSLFSNSKSILVRTPTSAPIMSCGTQTSSSVQFAWASVIGATGYEVSLDTGKTWLTPSSGSTGLSHIVAGLTGGKLIKLWARAITFGACARGNISSLICQTLGCPYVSFTYSGPKTSCLASDTSSKNENIFASNVNAIKYAISFNNQPYTLLNNGIVNIVKGANNIHIKIVDSLNLSCPQTDSVFLITGLNTPSARPILSFVSTGIDTTKKFCGSDVQTIFSSKPNGANSYLFLRNLTDSMQWGIKSAFTSGAKKFNNNEIVTVIATDTVSGCSKNSTFLLITVNPQPKANFTYQSISGLAKQFNDSSIGKTQTWNWNFGDNNFSSLKNTLHNYLTQGTFNVSLNISDSNNCKDSVSKAINVNTVGINALSEISELSVYPNPADYQIHISYELKKKSTLVINMYDMQGREIFMKINDTESIGAHDEQISIETLPSGIYLLMIKSGSQQRLVKFIKQ